MTLQFKLPIETNTHYIINDNILKDLEVIDAKTDEQNKSLFQIIYKPEHPVDEIIKDELMKTYTTDVSFLIQSQSVINGLTTQVPHDIFTNAYDVIREIDGEDDFHSKYQYIEVGLFKSLNNSPHFMQMLSFYNMLSPVITLLTPIVILILPFFLIRFQGVSLSMKAYFGTIKHLLRNHAIGKLADSFGSISWEKRIYLLITVSFYILQIYQNALSCYRFTRNMCHIHKQLFIIRDYLNHTCKSMRMTTEFVKTNDLDRFVAFTDSNETCLLTLRELLLELECITPLRISIPKACQVGNIMRLYYTIRHDDTIKNALLYSFKFNSYVNAMIKLGSLESLKPATFSNKSIWKTTNMKYPHHIGEAGHDNTSETVGNDFNLNKPILLTGPNASGKTTLLKSALLNTLLSQQVGRGFYDKLVIKPYDGFHCYLDIPDTSGRDSLFQAEARRCLNVITSISDNQSRFFCIFDELYSGTNPTEAVAGAFALTKHIAKQKNVTFVITTHFYDFCRLCEKRKIRIKNCQMDCVVDDKDSTVSFTYKMTSGISDVRGGMSVLQQIGYPSVITDDAISVLENKYRKV